jgi:hypothetical protein
MMMKYILLIFSILLISSILLVCASNVYVEVDVNSDSTSHSIGTTAARTRPTSRGSTIPTVGAGASGSGVNAILSIVTSSSCRGTTFRQRGHMPPGYIKGFALTWAKAVCNPQRSDMAIVSRPKSNDDAKDSLSWYAAKFQSLNMGNTGGLDTARHVYTLLLGLGMRESSGKHCCGRDMGANFKTSTSAEAGLFQTSFGAARSSSILAPMFRQYKANPRGCMLSNFREGVSCNAANLRNWGTGEGMEWQKLTKDCPAFAVEYGSVLLRTLGGRRGEFGPLRRREAEIKPECDQMLKQVQTYVQQHHDVCAQLNQ